jgi:hypothetical protein
MTGIDPLVFGDAAVSYYNTQLVNWLPILVIYADSPPAEELANELKLSGPYYRHCN